MSLELLSTEEAYARGLAVPDVYYAPGYGAAVAASDAAPWELAVWRDGRALVPLLRRRVPAELCDAAAAFDVVSPYGYAGPWARDDLGPGEAAAVRAALVGRLRDEGVVAEFHRLSSWLPGVDALAATPGVEVRTISETIALPLHLGPEALWERAEGRSRTSIRKARRLGYTASFRPATRADLATGAPFRALYEATMRRVGASPYYLFPDAYYAALLAGADVRIGQACDAHGTPRTAALFLPHGPFAHYHLSGSEPQAARDGANNLMIDEAIRALSAEGHRLLHLGGGVRAGDSLFAFKQGFGGDVLPFRVARALLHADRVAHLTRRRAEQFGCTPATLLATGFFPPYRAAPPP